MATVVVTSFLMVNSALTNASTDSSTTSSTLPNSDSASTSTSTTTSTVLPAPTAAETASQYPNRLPQLPTIPCTIAANGNAKTAPIGPSTAPPAMAAPKATAA